MEGSATDRPQNQRITVAVRAAYPEEGEHDWTELLRPLAEVGAVEVAFHKTHLFLDRVEISDVIAPFSKLRLHVTSIHMAHAKITESETFVETLKKTVRIAEALKCSVIVVHPSYGSFQGQTHEINAFFTQRIDPLLEAINATLCWETFASKKRFLSGIEEIAAFCQERPFHAACYDTSHLHKIQKEIIADIKSYAQVIKCFHLSNRSPFQQHLPLRHPEGKLIFSEILKAILDSPFSGPLTLEYLKEYHQHLLEDAQWVKEKLRENIGE